MLRRILSASFTAFLIWAAVVALIHGVWWRGLFLLVMGIFFAASLSARHLPVRLQAALTPKTPRGLGLLGVTVGAFFLIGAATIRNEPVAAAIMAASALLILGVGLEELLRARRLSRRSPTG